MWKQSTTAVLKSAAVRHQLITIRLLNGVWLCFQWIQTFVNLTALLLSWYKFLTCDGNLHCELLHNYSVCPCADWWDWLRICGLKP